jgi:hypothetical protein
MCEENIPEEKGFSNRQIPATLDSPLTAGSSRSSLP